jgi:transposase-like protein
VNSSSLGKIRQVLPREVMERLFVAEGRSAAAIAADTGVGKDAVLALVEEYGLVERATRPGVAARIDPDELYRLRCVEQVGMEELGRRLGVASGTAWGWMRRYGVPRRAPTLRQAADAPPPMPWLSQAVLVTMWEEGRTCEQIGEAADIDPDVVRRRLEAAGVLVRRKNVEHRFVGDPADPLSRTLLERLYQQQKMSPWEIARATNTTERQVTYRLKRFGIPGHRPSERTHLDDVTPELLRTLYLDQQRSTLEIAGMLQCSSDRVNELLHEYGIEVRPGAVRTSRGRTPLSREVLEDLHIARGLSAGQIALKLGYLSPTGEPSTGQVRGALYRHGLNVPRAAREISDADLKQLYTVEHLDEAQIGERLGWRTPHGKPSVAQIRQRLMRAGIDLRHAGGAPHADTSVLLRLYRQDGLSPEQIALRLNWFDTNGYPAATAVRKCLEHAGERVPHRTRTRYPPFDPEQLRRLYVGQDMTLPQVAEHLGWRTNSGALQVDAVKAALRSAGIPTRPAGPRAREKQ